MKILCCVTDPRYPYLIRGLGHVFRELGHKFIEWDIYQKPAFDAFDECEPHIYLGPLPATSWVIKGFGSINKCLEERKKRIKWKYLHEIPYAADTFSFSKGTYCPELATDVCYIGHYEPSVHKTVFESIEAKGLNFKIFGSGKWPLPQYLGNIAVETISDVYASSKVCLNFQSPERVYQILMSGSCPVSCEVGEPFKRGSSGHYQVVHRPQDYAISSVVLSCNKNQKTRQGMIDAGRELILSGHTYFHRVAQLFEEWGIEDEAKRVLDVYNASLKI